MVVLADGAVVPTPDGGGRAGSAMATAASVRELLGWEPRVAMLSFSTKGSSAHPDVDKVVAALKIVKDREPGLGGDGEHATECQRKNHYP